MAQRVGIDRAVGPGRGLLHPHRRDVQELVDDARRHGLDRAPLRLRQPLQPRAREAILSLLVSGGMLIPGNIPNIVSAGALRIGSAAWAKIGVPMGLVMLGIYFAVIKILS